MRSTTEIENILKELKPVLAEKYHVKSIALFGSYSNGMQKEDSDIDILVEFSRPVGFEFFDLKFFLEDKLGTKVDLITKNALKDLIKDDILKSAVYVY